MSDSPQHAWDTCTNIMWMLWALQNNSDHQASIDIYLKLLDAGEHNIADTEYIHVWKALLTGDESWKDLLTRADILDEKRRWMSSSINRMATPSDIYSSALSYSHHPLDFAMRHLTINLGYDNKRRFYLPPEHQHLSDYKCRRLLRKFHPKAPTMEMP